ncbi:MAG: hydrogenase maturation nickel metallochaperone HypA [Chloroflexota bacterium]
MHELAVTKSILKLALEHSAQNGAKNILAIHLLIGEMRNLEEPWIQRYFDYISKGTAAEKAVIKVKKIPVMFLCHTCLQQFTADLKIDQKILCTHCGSFEYDLISGRELVVEKLEAC